MILYYTKSLCPHCFCELPATVEEQDDAVFLCKTCPDHGSFRTVIWRDTAEGYLSWLTSGGLDVKTFPKTPEEAMSLCLSTGKADASPCSSALMVTNRCNNGCPICFTRDALEELYEPDFAELLKLLHFHAQAAPKAPLELCGGEPTIRDDLPRVVQAARNLGYDFIQINTNGIRFAEEPDYCTELARCGATTAYLGFDGFRKESYIQKYGRDLLDIKKQAIENCSAAGLAVVLVCCVASGGNEEELGDIIRFAKKHIPTVKGVFFQPLSFFGQYPKNDMQRLTIPDIIRAICKQSGGEIAPEHFLPGRCEHPQCSFKAFYQSDRNGRLYALTRMQHGARMENACLRVREAIKKTWKPGPQRTLTIGGMAFMDAWNMDALRLSRCTIQIIGRDRRLIPLCGKYVTNIFGKKLHPGIS